MISANDPEHINLFVYNGLASVEFQKQMRFFRCVEIRIIQVHSTHLHIIQQFNACHGNTGLDRGNNCLNRVINIFKYATGGRY